MIFAVACPLPSSSCPVSARCRADSPPGRRLGFAGSRRRAKTRSCPSARAVPQAPPGGRTYARAARNRHQCAESHDEHRGTRQEQQGLLWIKRLRRRGGARNDTRAAFLWQGIRVRAHIEIEFRNAIGGFRGKLPVLGLKIDCDETSAARSADLQPVQIGFENAVLRAFSSRIAQQAKKMSARETGPGFCATGSNSGLSSMRRSLIARRARSRDAMSCAWPAAGTAPPLAPPKSARLDLIPIKPAVRGRSEPASRRYSAVVAGKAGQR